MIIRVKVKRTEFEAAHSGNHTFGLYNGQKGIHVRVELGEEKPYLGRVSDNPKTEYRFFSGCDIQLAKLDTDSKEYLFVGVREKIAVIIYC